MVKKGVKSKTTKKRVKRAPPKKSLLKKAVSQKQSKTKIDVNLLLKNQNHQSSLTRKLLVVVAILAAFIALISLGNYSGNVTAPIDRTLFSIEGDIGTPYKVVDVSKSKNSAVQIAYTSTIKTNVFVETNDCDAWKKGKDSNNHVLYAISNIKSANFKVGDSLQNTRQQLDLYQTENLCLIVINKETPSSGKFTLTATETDNNIYNIIE
ncbi:hypothetical protein CL617_03965 [archaeon]|nr:hypothetical protein [archaeon]|tara:strand:- start:5445 stop:6071 length:627 start_codon:yes stop_codon:yes gene_type:complete